MKFFKIIIPFILLISLLVVPCSAAEPYAYGWSPSFRDESYNIVLPYHAVGYENSYEHIADNVEVQYKMMVTVEYSTDPQFSHERKIKRHFENDVLPYLRACYYQTEIPKGKFTQYSTIGQNNKEYIDRAFRFAIPDFCRDYDEISIYQFADSLALGGFYYIDHGEPVIDGDTVAYYTTYPTVYIRFELTWNVPFRSLFPNVVRGGEEAWDKAKDRLLNEVGICGYFYLPEYNGYYGGDSIDLLLTEVTGQYTFSDAIIQKASGDSSTYPLMCAYTNFPCPGANRLQANANVWAGVIDFYSEGYSLKKRELCQTTGWSGRDVTNGYEDFQYNMFVVYTNLADPNVTVTHQYVNEICSVWYQNELWNPYDSEVLAYLCKCYGSPYMSEYSTDYGYVESIGLPKFEDAAAWFDAYLFTTGLVVYYNSEGQYSFIKQSTTSNSEYDISSLYTSYFADWDDSAGWFQGICNFFVSLFTHTLPAIFYNLMIWVFCESPVVSNVTRPLFLGVVETGNAIKTWVFPFLTISGILTAFIMTLLVLKIIKRYLKK